MLLADCARELVELDSKLSAASDKGFQLSSEIWEGNNVVSFKDALKFQEILDNYSMSCVLFTETVRTVDIIEMAVDSQNIDDICNVAADTLKDFINATDLLNDNVKGMVFSNNEITLWKNSLLHLTDAIVEFLQNLTIINILVKRISR